MSVPVSDLEIWPTLAIELITERLRLRPVWGPDVFEVGRAAGLGVHNSQMIPFMTDWATADSPKMERGVARWIWKTLASQTPESWSLYFGVWLEGTLIGAQDVGGMNFGKLGEVHTGSWLARPYQGLGYGKEMRTAVLDLAFGGLGAKTARSGAREDNPASLGVSRALGYQEDGTQVTLFGDQVSTEIRLLMSRETWLANNHEATIINGLSSECLAMLGAD